MGWAQPKGHEASFSALSPRVRGCRGLQSTPLRPSLSLSCNTAGRSFSWENLQMFPSMCLIVFKRPQMETERGSHRSAQQKKWEPPASVSISSRPAPPTQLYTPHKGRRRPSPCGQGSLLAVNKFKHVDIKRNRHFGG